MGERPLFWIRSSLKDLSRFPAEVQKRVGYALSAAQFGGKHPGAKPWKGDGSGVLEIVEDHRGDTYPAVYTVRFEEAVYVLHVFQKKSKQGIATTQADSELIGRRLKDAVRDHEERYGQARSNVVTQSSGNVFADLGLPNAEELGAKVRLCVAINRILEAREMTQVEAARVLGVSQPKVSALRGYKLEGFSVERLMHFVTALEHDVVIEIRPKARDEGRVMVVSAA